MATYTLPMLIFSVSYLFIFGILVGLMPIVAPNLLYGGKDYAQFDVPDYFDSWDIENIKFLEDNNLTYPQPAIDYDYTPDVNVRLYAEWVVLNPYITLDVYTWEFWIFWTAEDMYFTSMQDRPLVENNMYIGKNELVLAWDENFNASIFTAQAEGIIKVKCWFLDTNSTRNDIEQAFDDGKITLAVGFGIDDVETSYNVFTLIGLLLAFSRPEIFGATGIVAVTLNLIVASPVFISIGYLVFYFVTSIIPFIRGA